MTNFCGPKPIWDLNLTWTSSTLDFPSCFMDTTLVWIPSGFIWIFCIYEFLRIKKSSQLANPWTLLLIEKMILSAVLCGLNAAEMIHAILIYSDNIGIFPVDFYTPLIKLTTFVLTGILIYYNRKKGLHSSGFLTIFWLLAVIGYLAKYRSLLQFAFIQSYDNDYYVDDLVYIAQTATFPILIAQLILACISDTRSAIFAASYNAKKETPEESASFISQLTFWWFNRMVSLGYRKPLTQDDMWDLSVENKAIRSSESFEKTCINTPVRNTNILWPLFKTFWLEISITLLLKLSSSLMLFVNPIVLDYLITFISSNDPDWIGYFYTAIMVGSSFLASMFTSQYEYAIFSIGMRMRSALTTALYKKSLLLSTSGKKAFTVGEIVNLMAVDTQRILDFVQICMDIISCPLELALSIYLLWQQLGIATVAPIVVLLLLIPFNTWTSRFISKMQGKLMREKDKRSRLINEVLNGIKILKLYAWENSFTKIIMDIRKRELDILKVQTYYFILMTFSFTSTPFLVAIASFATFILIDSSNVLNANNTFVTLSLINMLQMPLITLTRNFYFGSLFFISIKRINDYLKGQELEKSDVNQDQDKTNAILVHDSNFCWSKDDDKPQLSDISFSVPHGKLVAIVGQVGAGKSSLLSALLGEMHMTNGYANVSGSVAYVPQTAWIQNATVRQNVIFSKAYEPTKYNEILETCALGPDLEMLAAGDLTEIGERGINLSGGQKQRISLARAVYCDSDIYYLDDPLSAVDSNVGKQLFEKVIGPNGLLRNKTRILATHKLSILPEVDMILVMEDGKISEQGTYQDLMAKKGHFAEYLIQFLTQIHDDSEENEDLSFIQEISEDLRPVLQRVVSKKIDLLNKPVQSTPTTSKIKRNVSISNEPKSKKTQVKGKLIETEASQTGSVKSSTYLDYLKCFGFWGNFLTIFGFAASSAFNIGNSLWLTEWSEDSTSPNTVNDIGLRNLRLGIYACLGSFESFFILLGCSVMYIAVIRASKIIHNNMLLHIIKAPMSFFDTTPTGRILNRFTKDIDTADITMRQNLRFVLMFSFRTLVSIIIISFETPLFLVALIPLAILYYFMQKYYIATSRQLRRIESTARSPIYNHFSETVTGATSIRAYKASERFINECNQRIDSFHSCYYPNITAARWLSVRLEFLGYIIIFLSALIAVITRDTIEPAIAGLAISYSLTITRSLSMLIQSYSQLETDIVAIERCLEYTKTPVEKDWFIYHNKPNRKWPSNGMVKFQNYSTRYRDGLELVLKNINCEIGSNEKVGIVGRTGAGKSSMTLAFFRIIEPASGTIFIDGIDISKLGLYDLRSRLTIIPQDPVLFTGALRINLDPFNNYTDEEIWKSLELAHLKPFIASLMGTLSYEITEGGENLSVGQRQLICLARALLRKSKILVLDEATAAVDLETDELIQKTIREEFKDCTIITIAHRLNTIIDYDKIIVMDDGRISEFETPQRLLEDESSSFYSMAKDAGII